VVERVVAEIVFAYDECTLHAYECMASLLHCVKQLLPEYMSSTSETLLSAIFEK